MKMLAPIRCNITRLPSKGAVVRPAPARLPVLVRAEPPSGGAKVTREYREDSDEIVQAPSSQPVRQPDGSIYVDTNAPVRVSVYT